MTAHTPDTPPVIAPRRVYVNFYGERVGNSQCYQSPQRAKTYAFGGPTETAVEFEEVFLCAPSTQPVIAPEWVMLTDDDFDQIAQTAFQAHTTGRYGSWEGVQPWVTAAFKTIQAAFIDKQGGAA